MEEETTAMNREFRAGDSTMTRIHLNRGADPTFPVDGSDFLQTVLRELNSPRWAAVAVTSTGDFEDATSRKNDLTLLKRNLEEVGERWRSRMDFEDRTALKMALRLAEHNLSQQEEYLRRGRRDGFAPIREA